jgi:predicted RNase H-like HicB family nuclease
MSRQYTLQSSAAIYMLVKFEVCNDGEYWCARGIGEDIFTQGKTLDNLMNNIKEAVETHFIEVLERGGQIQVLSLSEIEVKPFAKVTSS